MSWPLIIAYAVLAVLGSTLLKFGAKVAPLFTLPLINFPISFVTILGFLFYGLSFLVYTSLLAKNDLSIISPLTVGIVYVMLMVVAFIFFGEAITLQKIIGSLLVLAGVLTITIKVG